MAIRPPKYAAARLFCHVIARIARHVYKPIVGVVGILCGVMARRRIFLQLVQARLSLKRCSRPSIHMVEESSIPRYIKI